MSLSSQVMWKFNPQVKGENKEESPMTKLHEPVEQSVTSMKCSFMGTSKKKKSLVVTAHVPVSDLMQKSCGSSDQKNKRHTAGFDERKEGTMKRRFT